VFPLTTHPLQERPIRTAPTVLFFTMQFEFVPPVPDTKIPFLPPPIRSPSMRQLNPPNETPAPSPELMLPLEIAMFCPFPAIAVPPTADIEKPLRSNVTSELSIPITVSVAPAPTRLVLRR